MRGLKLKVKFNLRKLMGILGLVFYTTNTWTKNKNESRHLWIRLSE